MRWCVKLIHPKNSRITVNSIGDPSKFFQAYPLKWVMFENHFEGILILTICPYFVSAADISTIKTNEIKLFKSNEAYVYIA